MNIKVSSVKEAWELADRLFPTDYEKDEGRSSRTGHPIYYSTVENTNAWISDLGSALELNYDGKSENILIEQNIADPSGFSYKIFISDSSDAVSLIASGLRASSKQNFVEVCYGSACASMGKYMGIIPDIYKKPGKFYAILTCRPKDGKSPEYELTVC